MIGWYMTACLEVLDVNGLYLYETPMTTQKKNHLNLFIIIIIIINLTTIWECFE